MELTISNKASGRELVYTCAVMNGANAEMWFDWGSENVFLICHTKVTPDGPTWSAACRTVAEGLKRTHRVGTLVLTDGGGPSTAQREELAQATERRKYPVSVISDAPGVRFIASTMALFIPEMKSFLPEDWHKALAHLGMDAMERKTMERAIRDWALRPSADRFEVLKSVASSIR